MLDVSNAEPCPPGNSDHAPGM
jgi:ABC-type uncharacterized transport system substrate-binding protein